MGIGFMSESFTTHSCPSDGKQAGIADSCAGCPGRELCMRSNAEDPGQRQMDVRMNAIRHKILVVAGKGGVGKSSLAVGLAVSLAAQGNQVGLLDVDICGPSVPRLLNMQGRSVQESPYGWIPPCPAAYPTLKVISAGFLTQQRDTPIVWRGPRKTSLIKRFLKDTYWGRLDYLIVDTPPGTSDEHLSVVAALKSARPDGAVIVTTPQEISSITVRREITFCRKMALPVLGIVENMSGFACPCCEEITHIYEGSAGARLAEEYSLPFLGEIPLDPRVSQCGDSGSVLTVSHPESPATKKTAAVVETLLKQLT